MRILKLLEDRKEHNNNPLYPTIFKNIGFIYFNLKKYMEAIKFVKLSQKYFLSLTDK
jgi:hypothetical protein